jgi:hypothetical protein
MSGLAFDEIKRDRWGREIPHPAAIEQNRLARLARDEIEAPANAEQGLQAIAEIFANLEDDDANDLATMLEKRLDEGAQDSLRRGRRGARDRRVARDQPPAFAGRPSTGGRRAMDSATSDKLPSTEELWPNALKNRVA